MITLTLLHPLQSIPVQSWTFDSETVVRIGRAVDNDVVLYSAVVSRYHVELRAKGSSWEVVSIGANGTYFDGKLVDRVPVTDGMVFRLATSGPQIQVKLCCAPVGEKPPLDNGDGVSVSPPEPKSEAKPITKNPWYDSESGQN